MAEKITPSPTGPAPAEPKKGEQPDPTTRETTEERGLSRQAQFSTYTENTDLPDARPAPGRHVVQELGKPRED